MVSSRIPDCAAVFGVRAYRAAPLMRTYLPAPIRCPCNTVAVVHVCAFGERVRTGVVWCACLRRVRTYVGALPRALLVRTCLPCTGWWIGGAWGAFVRSGVASGRPRCMAYLPVQRDGFPSGGAVLFGWWWWPIGASVRPDPNKWVCTSRWSGIVRVHPPTAAARPARPHA